MLDVGAGAAGRRSALVYHGLTRVLLCQPTGVSVERRGEEQRLSRCRTQRDDPVNRGPEPYVEHPVGLVQDQHLDLVEREGAAREQVLEAPGSRDEHMRTGCVSGLLDQTDAAVDRGHGECAGMRDGANVIHDLGGQLARRREHQG